MSGTENGVLDVDQKARGRRKAVVRPQDERGVVETTTESSDDHDASEVNCGGLNNTPGDLTQINIKGDPAVEMSRLMDWKEKCQAVADECRDLLLEVDNAKSSLKEAKDRYDGKILELRRAVSEGPSSPKLFDGVDELTPPAANDAWRYVTLEDAGFPNKIRKSLEEHHPSVTTIGQLADLTSQGDWWHKDVKGLGEKAVEQIDELMTEFWKTHPEYMQSPPASAEEPSQSSGSEERS